MGRPPSAPYIFPRYVPCIFPCVFLNLWSQERVRRWRKSEFWSNLARFGSRNGILTKWHNDSASFLPEKLKNQVILTKNLNIWLNIQKVLHTSQIFFIHNFDQGGINFPQRICLLGQPLDRSWITRQPLDRLGIPGQPLDMSKFQSSVKEIGHIGSTTLVTFILKFLGKPIFTYFCWFLG